MATRQTEISIEYDKFKTEYDKFKQWFVDTYGIDPDDKYHNIRGIDELIEVRNTWPLDNYSRSSLKILTFEEWFQTSEENRIIYKMYGTC